MALSIRLFGSFDVSPLATRCSRKGEWLLALLVLRAGREVDRAFLAGTLWPDTSEPQALYDLRRELSRLRRALGDEAERLRSPGTRGLTLDLAGADVDVTAFDVAIARGNLEEAVARYRGPLLEGCTEVWALEEREARAQTFLGALEKLATREVARGDFATAVGHLRRATAADPLRESAHRALMTALAANGAPAAAAQVYRELRSLLGRELGAEPAPETRALYQKLRATAPAAPRENEAVTHKSHARGTPVGRVPVPLTPLVGRADEVREISTRLRASRLLTLTGSGGVGKSRLAVQVASDLGPDLAEGAWFVELAPLADPDLVAPAVASVLGLHEAPGQPVIDRLSTFLAGREVLLVLDNCEHVLDAAGHLAERLLHDAPGLRILATSRQSLGVAGEIAWRVPSLIAGDAIALFHERAGQRFEEESVAQICQRLDGIPLAIELAAARTRVLTVAQIAARLDDRFRLLTGGSRTALPRHRTLKAAVDWGYQILSGEEQALLRLLSVFSGGFTLEAAEAVSGRDVLDLLESLVDKSLVSFDGRYRLLETVRQYAAERLREHGEAQDARARHLDCFVRLGEAAAPHVFGGEGDRTWIARLEEENDNLRTAFDTCEAGMAAGDPRGAEAALRLVASLHWFWFARGHLREGRTWTAAALAHRSGAPADVRALALAAAGYVALWIGDYAGMSPVLHESLALAGERGDRRLSAYALCGLGAAAINQGNPVAALPLLLESVALSRAERDEGMLVFTLYWLGTGALNAGDPAGAGASLLEALDLSRRIGLRPGVAHTLFRLGQVAESAGDVGEARRRYLESLGVLEASADRWGTTLVLDALARLALAAGRTERGACLLGATEALCEQLGSSVMPGREVDERALAAARGALGEPAFAAAWADGRALRFEQAVALARVD